MSALFRVGQSLNPYHTPLQDGLCFFPTSQSRTSNSVPYGSPAYNRQRYEVTTFHTIDPLDDLGASSTPVVQQFRAGSYETCILPTSAHTGERPSTF